MKFAKTVLFLALAALGCLPMHAQTYGAPKPVVDTFVDVLHYDLTLDIGNHTYKRIEGSATVTMRVCYQRPEITLELSPSDIDSVFLDGVATAFTYSSSVLRVPFQGSVGDTVTVTVFYRKGEEVMTEGWGGFYFDDNIYYNLGIALYEYPHNVGKAWFPCRDSFTDKATYRMRIVSKPGWRAICSGMPVSETENSDGSMMTEWTLDHPTPTYLVGVAVAPFHVIERSYQSVYCTYPAILGFLSHDSVGVWNAFDNMSRVIPMYERCFGPYRWDRVGYVSTPKGSMEHVGNIAFTTYCMASMDEACLATMSHEFAHSWFGNLVTCYRSQDMWINEGGASFCEEVAIQALCPGGDSMRYKTFADENLCDVLLHTHIKDNGFKPLYGPTSDYTYGSTVYDKGATVWHSLRGYMGDSLFYSSLRTLFSRCAFGNIDSWQLRDSLSLYSGMDLTAFFDFHVFGPGFNDYDIDSLLTEGNRTTVFVRQKNYGTTALADANRVWVTFFSPELDEERRLVTFDGEAGMATFELPFRPAFAIVDYDKELSKASIGTLLATHDRGTFDMPLSQAKIKITKNSDTCNTWLYVTHHWSRPDSSLSPQILRMASRYWRVSGILPDAVKASGMFRFCRTGADATLDNGFFSPDEIDQVRLLYRPNSSSPWTVATAVHSGTSTGYFTMNTLKLGEYTLAIIDTGYVGTRPVADPASEHLRVFPNPSDGNVTIQTAVPGERLVVTVCDGSGRTVCGPVDGTSGSQLHLSLHNGLYLFTVYCPGRGRVYREKVQIRNF